MRRPALWFIVPAHGRSALTAICLRQLRRTCDALVEHGIDASAVVIADRANLRALGPCISPLGFATIERDNVYLSRKFNDGIQLACDPRYNPRPADYVVPCGSDDWVDYRILLDLPRPDTVLGFQRISFVREDGREMVARLLDYPGGSGIRVYPRQLLTALRYRPADEDRARACDTSILTNVQRRYRNGVRVEHAETDARQIVDWKSAHEQLNPYDALLRYRAEARSDPFVDLVGVYPNEALHEMARHYGRKIEACSTSPSTG